MHSNVTIKNVSWPHFSWPTVYIDWPLFGVPVRLPRRRSSEKVRQQTLRSSDIPMSGDLITVSRKKTFIENKQ